MALPEVAAIIANRLNASGLEWMATGSIAAMTYGEYRVTNDVDIILTLSQENIDKLIAAFPIAEFYCPPADVIEVEVARENRGHFNLIHHETGFKADIYIAGRDELTRWALRERRQVDLGDSMIWIAPPEYIVIGKLEFFREGGSEKHLRDIRGMLAVTEMDREFLEREIARRGLEEPWRAVKTRE
jgi:hypothetical protein